LPQLRQFSTGVHACEQTQSADDANEPLVCKCGNIAIKQTRSSHDDLFGRRLREKEWFQRGTISMEVGELLS
jgi:hypothetical protein